MRLITMLAAVAACASLNGFARGQDIIIPCNQFELAGTSVEIDGQEWIAWQVFYLPADPALSVTAVFGDSTLPLQITAGFGAFYNHPLGSDTAPNEALVTVIPELAFDSFVDIGTSLQVPGSLVGLSVGFPPVEGSELFFDDHAWFRLPDDPLTFAAPTPGGQMGVFIGQFTLPNGATLNGSVNIAEADAKGKKGTSIYGLTFATEIGQCSPACPSDTNGDGVTDVTDLVAVVVAWGTSDPAADVNDDGTVDVGDLVLVINGWGDCPE